MMLEDRLREYYRDEAAGLEAADLLPGVLAAGRRARRRARLLGAAALAAVVVVLAAGSAELSGRADGRPAVHPPASRPFTVLTRTELAGWGPPSGMAAVPGGVWLESWDEGGLLRIDAATGQVTARVRVGRPQEGPYSLAYGAGSLWVTDFWTGDLLRLNPASGRVIAKVHVGGLYVTVGGGFVWVTKFGHVRGPYWNRLVKIDPATDRIVGDVLLPGNYGPTGAMVAAGAAVWLRIDGAPSVQAVDPAQMRVTAHAQTGVAQGLAPVGRLVWVLTDDGSIERVSPPWSTAARGPVRLPQLPNGTTSTLAGNIAAAPGGTLWAGGKALYQVSQATMRFRTFSRFGPVDDVAALGATLWVQGGNGSVYQLALHQPRTVPDVVLTPVAAAERLLTRDGYTVKVAREAGLEPLGRVIFQHPAAGLSAPHGTKITLVISAGPATQSGSP